MTKAALVGNGIFEGNERIHGFETIIAVDGGLAYLDKMGITPTRIVGDLDSVDEALLQKYAHVPTIKYPTDKDYSDMELALLEVQDFDEITLFGAFGKRIDHSLYNIVLLRRYPGKLIMDTGHQIAFCLNKAFEFPTKKGQIISLLPLSDSVLGLNTKGLKWELSDATFTKEHMSLSNIALSSKVSIEFQKGELLVTVVLS